MNRLRIQLTCGVIAAFLAIVANAEPPMFKETNRTYGNSAYAYGCYDIEGGYRCPSISVYENYDVKGEYEDTYLYNSHYVYRHDPSDGSYEYRYRDFGCPVDQKSIKAGPNGVAIDVAIDTEAPECWNYGYYYGWNPQDGYYSGPWNFWGTVIFRGEWVDPFSYQETQSKYKSTYYDGWSNTTDQYMTLCKEKHGDQMKQGGWSVTRADGRTFFRDFNGPDGPMFGYYQVSSCNRNNARK